MPLPADPVQLPLCGTDRAGVVPAGVAEKGQWELGEPRVELSIDVSDLSVRDVSGGEVPAMGMGEAALPTVIGVPHLCGRSTENQQSVGEDISGSGSGSGSSGKGLSCCICVECTCGVCAHRGSTPALFGCVFLAVAGELASPGELAAEKFSIFGSASGER